MQKPIHADSGCVTQKADLKSCQQRHLVKVIHSKQPLEGIDNVALPEATLDVDASTVCHVHNPHSILNQYGVAR
jgi:hypothetical protein